MDPKEYRKARTKGYEDTRERFADEPFEALAAQAQNAGAALAQNGVGQAAYRIGELQALATLLDIAAMDLTVAQSDA